MFSNIFQKTLYEKRWALLAWSVGFLAMVLLTMLFYPYFKNSGFDQVIKQLPKSFEGVLGKAADYKTVPGYVDQQIFALRMPMMTLIMAIALFVGVGAGSESRGTLETLLALPVNRSKVYWQKFAAMATICGAGCAVIGLSVLASFPLIHGSMGLVRLAEACFACWLLTMVFGSLAYAIGAITGHRGVTIGVASAIAFGSYLISSLAPAVQKLSVAQKFTPFYYYNTPSVATNGLDWGNVLVLAATIAVLYLAGWLVFERRDLQQRD